MTLPGGTVVTNTDLIRHRQIDEWDAGWVPTLTTTRGDWTLSLKGELRFHSGHSFGSVQWAQYYPPDVPPDHRYYDYKLGKRSASLLATATWKATGALSLTAGLEAAQKRYDLNHDVLTGVNFVQSYDFLLPRLGAVLHLSSATDLYANVARGEHEPAFRTLYDPEGEYSTERTTLRPEDVWDWEGGVSIHHQGWRARANVFFMNFVNEIVYSGALDSSGVPIYGNGAHSHHEGLELDASADPLPYLGFDGTLTLSHNTFVAYHDYNGDGSINVYDGNVLGGYPGVLASLTARLRVGAAQVALAGRYVGQFYLDNTQDNRRNPDLRQAPGYVPLVNPGVRRRRCLAAHAAAEGVRTVARFQPARPRRSPEQPVQPAVHRVRVHRRRRFAAVHPRRHPQRVRRSDPWALETAASGGGPEDQLAGERGREGRGQRGQLGGGQRRQVRENETVTAQRRRELDPVGDVRVAGKTGREAAVLLDEGALDHRCGRVQHTGFGRERLDRAVPRVHQAGPLLARPAQRPPQRRDAVVEGERGRPTPGDAQRLARRHAEDDVLEAEALAHRLHPWHDRERGEQRLGDRAGRRDPRRDAREETGPHVEVGEDPGEVVEVAV